LKRKTRTREVNELIQQTRIALKAELPVNNYNLKPLELPGETEKNIRAALTTEDGKTVFGDDAGKLPGLTCGNKIPG
jgi:hypothetical protein